MKYCSSCKVTIQNNRSKCPLCESELATKGDDFECDYPAVLVTGKTEKNTRALIFCTAVLVAACVLVDIFTSQVTHWSILAGIGLLYLWLSIRFIKKSRRNIGLLALIQVFGISTLSFFIDSATGYYRWSTNYVIPFVIISAAGLLSLVLVLRPKRFRDYILYQIGISVLGVAVSVTSLLDRHTTAWTGIVGVAYSGLTLLGIIVFTSRKTKHELRKRFHF